MFHDRFQGAFVVERMSDEARVAARSDVVSCELDGGAALLDMRSSLYYGLNPVGAFVWSKMSEPRTVDELAQAVLAEYDVPDQQCRDDLHRLLESLAAADLIQVDHAPAA